MSPPGAVLIGTSGWSYRHWVGPFYPEGTRSRDFLGLYAGSFRTAELNTTFYSLPKAETLAAWREAVPAGFAFACKASRYITHMKKLKDPEMSTARFFAAVEALGDRLGPILFQLPPSWGCDPGRLEAFLAGLPGGRRYAFEFRDASWFTDEVHELLARHGAAQCVYHLAGYVSPLAAAADFAYLRLHGPEAEAYRGGYDDVALAGWADLIAGWRAEGRDVYCYFDNDENGHAPNDALRLVDMVAARAG